MRVITDENRAEFQALFNSGMNIGQIARKTGRSWDSVRLHIKGLDDLDRRADKIEAAKRERTALSAAVTEYYKTHSCLDTCAKFGISSRDVVEFSKKQGFRKVGAKVVNETREHEGKPKLKAFWPVTSSARDRTACYNM
jgi:plasmid replication initiation protein